MKKIIRLTALILLAITVISSLSGCKMLDRMRDTHGIVSDDGSVIDLGGKKYLRLPECEDLSLSDVENTVRVTGSDVPVLVAHLNGPRFYTSNDGVFLSFSSMLTSFPGLYGNDYEHGLFDDFTVYCREDRYDEICNRIENVENEFELYCYEYYSLDPEDFIGEYKTQILTSEQSAAIDHVMNTVEGTVVPNGTWLDSIDYISVNRASRDLLFMRYLVNIELVGDTYYIVNYMDQTYIHQVPKILNNVFADIFAAQSEGEPYKEW